MAPTVPVPGSAISPAGAPFGSNSSSRLWTSTRYCATIRPPMNAMFSIASLRSGTIVFIAGGPVRLMSTAAMMRLGASLSERRNSVEPLVPNGAYSASLTSKSALIGAVTFGDVEAVLVLGPFRHDDQEIPAVLRNDGVDHPAWAILALVDQRVLRLRRADAVVVHGVSGQRGFEHLVLRRLRIAGIEEALAVPRPRD